MAAFLTTPLPLINPALHTSTPRCRRRAPIQATLAERVTAKPAAPAPTPTPTSMPTDEPVEVLESGEALDAALDRSKRQLVVVRVHARWCRSCRAMEPKWRRLARELTNAHFVEFEFEANRILAARLAVKVMPTFCIYDNGVKVDHFSAGPRRAHILRERIEIAADNRQRRLDGLPLRDVPDAARSEAEKRN